MFLFRYMSLDVELTNVRNGIRLVEVSGKRTCVYSGDIIPEGAPAILFRLEDKWDSAFLAVDRWQEFVKTIEDHSFEGGKLVLSPTGRTRRGIVERDSVPCVMCDRKLESGSSGLALVGTTKHEYDTVFCHPDCVADLIEGVRNVEKHSDEIVSYNI